MVQESAGTPRRRLRSALACTALVVPLLVAAGQRPAAAALSGVRGSACAYKVNVGLFGGPQNLKGCGSGVDPSTIGYAPDVSLPPGGSATAVTASDIDGAKAQYGPAVIHGGMWPDDVASPTASGPQYASTQGTAEGGTVTSSADITLRAQPYPIVTCEAGFTPPCDDPGGFGPPPVWGDSLHAECTATASSVTGKATFSQSFIARGTDAGGAPDPTKVEAIPPEPPPNYTRHGVITNVGDVFAVVLNEQIVNADGSLTVNAVHMYLFGPVAVGELIRGQVTCGTSPSAIAPNDTVAPTCGTPVVAPIGPQDPTPKTPHEELVGVFDAGGLKDIVNKVVVNGEIRVGSQPPSLQPYLNFTPGQTGPLPVTAVRSAAAEDAGLPLKWSFDAVDMAGNVSHCAGVIDSNPPVGGGGSTGGGSTGGGSGGTSGGVGVAGEAFLTLAGYRLVGSDGGIFAFGAAPFLGSTASLALNKPIVATAATKSGLGYWLAAADGAVFAFGDAKFSGSMGGKPLNKPIVGFAATPTGAGYWLVASDGGIFAFGDATFYGSMGAKPLNKPIVGIAVAPSGGGYWMVASDGGIFAFGDAKFFGSTGAIALNQPIVALAVSPGGSGYLLAASDGGIFAFGDAKFYGSMGAKPLNKPIVAVAGTPAGYLLAASDGGIFAFGDAKFLGSTGALTLNKPIIGMSTTRVTI
ncbi:MAG TPA: hypothetical protein VHM89_06680 [Acidimicrobiales bacterium]|nr:hypothetical protein [Acidimicrobiales bacterium]